MLTTEAIKQVLGITEKVSLSTREMADEFNVTFFPRYNQHKVSAEVLKFKDELRNAFVDLKTNIVPYDESLERVSMVSIAKRLLKAFANNVVAAAQVAFRLERRNEFIGISGIKFILRRTKLKKGIAVVVLGEQPTGELPMELIRSFRDNSIITVVDWPEGISNDSTFEEHFNASLSLFAYHMTNIILAVGKDSWLLYNFNASHPIYKRGAGMRAGVLDALIPKIVAPIRPYKFSEFEFVAEPFDPYDLQHCAITDSLLEGSRKFAATKLYPPGRKLDQLPFRNSFYRWIGKLHLDNRSGMSYGFMAHQLPGAIEKLHSIEESEVAKLAQAEGKDVFRHGGRLCVIIEVRGSRLWMAVPEVAVLSQRSGSDKTNIDPKRDFIKLGLKDGVMSMQAPLGTKVTPDYKPSFDTKVILAHAVGNAILASILEHLSPGRSFAQRYVASGFSINHWHGYFHPSCVPEGYVMYGIRNPHVACSSPQSAIYALEGKLAAFQESIIAEREYVGDIHVEPHHGTNICFSSGGELAEYLVANKEASVLGNKYLDLYFKEE